MRWRGDRVDALNLVGSSIESDGVDNMGNDLVRFIQTAIGKATIVAGLSSGAFDALSCDRSRPVCAKLPKPSINVAC